MHPLALSRLIASCSYYPGKSELMPSLCAKLRIMRKTATFSSFASISYHYEVVEGRLSYIQTGICSTLGAQLVSHNYQNISTTRSPLHTNLILTGDNITMKG